MGVHQLLHLPRELQVLEFLFLAFLIGTSLLVTGVAHAGLTIGVPAALQSLTTGHAVLSRAAEEESFADSFVVLARFAAAFERLRLLLRLRPLAPLRFSFRPGLL